MPGNGGEAETNSAELHPSSRGLVGQTATLRITSRIGATSTDTVSAMRWSWLSSPTVTLIGLLAALITLVQWGVLVARSIRQVAQDADKRRRASIWIVRLSLAAVVAVSALSWTAVHATAVQAGYLGWAGALYPVVATAADITADWALLVGLRKGRPFLWSPCSLLISVLALQAATLYLHGGVPEWRRYAAAPTIALAVLPSVLFAYGIGKRLAARLSGQAPAVSHSTTSTVDT
jgi:hypothetical protein